MGGKDKASNTYSKVDELRNFASRMEEWAIQTADAMDLLAGATDYGKGKAASGY